MGRRRANPPHGNRHKANVISYRNIQGYSTIYASFVYLTRGLLSYPAMNIEVLQTKTFSMLTIFYLSYIHRKKSRNITVLNLMLFFCFRSRHDYEQHRYVPFTKKFRKRRLKSLFGKNAWFILASDWGRGWGRSRTRPFVRGVKNDRIYSSVTYIAAIFRPPAV